MMKYIHNWKNAIIGRLAMLALLLTGGVCIAQADNKITVGDFKIAPGETKTVSVSMENDADNIQSIEFKLSLPAGLEYVTEAGTNNKQVIKIALNSDRLPGWTKYGSTTGSVTLTTGVTLKSAVGTSGELFTFQVKANENLAETTTLGITITEVMDADEKEISFTGQSATVTRGEGGDEPGPNPDDPTDPVVTLALAKSAVVVAPGKTVLVDAILNNNIALTQGFAEVEAPEGWTVSVVDGDVANEAEIDSRFFNNSGIAKNVNAVAFRLSITAPADFSGKETLTLKKIKFMANLLPFELKDLKLTLMATGLDIRFAETALNSAPGRKVEIPVLLDNEFPIDQFQANLTAPEDWNASVTDGRLANAGTLPRIMFKNEDDPIVAGTGTLFTITATVPAEFLGVANIGLNTIKAMDYLDKYLGEDLTATVDVKDEAGKAAADEAIAALQEKLDAAKAKIEKDYPAAAKDDDIQRALQIIQQGIVDMQGQVDGDYNGYKFVTLDSEEVSDLEDAIDNVLDEAENYGNKDNEAGKAALDDEIAALQKKLDDAKDEIPSDLPKDATKELSDDADAIQDQIDALKAQVEQDYKDGKLTPDSKLDPEKKQKVLDDIDALLKKIHTWLRGDVDNDGDVDMDDFYALKKLISEEKTPTDAASNFFYRCDANADGEINVGDLQGILNICVGLKANGK